MPLYLLCLLSIYIVKIYLKNYKMENCLSKFSNKSLILQTKHVKSRKKKACKMFVGGINRSYGYEKTYTV